MKNKKKRIMITVLCLLLIAVAAACVLAYAAFAYDEDKIVNMLQQYITDRYHEVNYNNVEDKIENQNKYYTEKMKSGAEGINSEDSIKAAVEYFRETNYDTMLMTNLLDKIERDRYYAHVTVLYANDYPPEDNYVEYEYEFKIKKEGLNEYKIDGIEQKKNVVTYLNGKEIHIHDGTIFLCDPQEEPHTHD